MEEAAGGGEVTVPEWLESLLTTSFFSGCFRHKDGPRTECNMFCLDCSEAGGAFCFYCRSSRHHDHAVIQIRRSSYHDVVRVAEVESLLDTGGVQTYVINSAKVVFLNERPLPKNGGGGGSGTGGGGGGGGGGSSSKGVMHLCEICGRSLLDPCRFCSLGCKLARIKRNGDASFRVTIAGGRGGGGGGGDDDDDEIMEERIRSGRGNSFCKDEWREEKPQQEDGPHVLQQLNEDSPPPSPALASSPPPPPPAPKRSTSNPRRRSRKGIPQRAPFFGS